jgi:PEP-CTERM motif
MTKYLRLMVVAIVLAVVGRTATVEAAPIIFDNRAAYEHAVGSFTTHTFDTVAPCVFDPANFTCVQTYGPVNFAFDIAGIPSGPNVLHLGISGQAIGTTLSSPLHAFGLDLVGGTPGSSLGLVLGTAWGPSVSTLLLSAVPTFFGVVADDPFTALQVSVVPQGPDSVVTIDNLTVATVPEPATFLLLGTAALGLFAAANTRRRKKQPGVCEAGLKACATRRRRK